jgi:hypothetical protein
VPSTRDFRWSMLSTISAMKPGELADRQALAQ